MEAIALDPNKTQKAQESKIGPDKKPGKSVLPPKTDKADKALSQVIHDKELEAKKSKSKSRVKSDNTLIQLFDNPLVSKYIPYAATGASMIGNLSAGLCAAVGANPSIQETLKRFGVLSNKAFLFANAANNVVKEGAKNNLGVAAGYGIDFPIALLSKGDDIYLDRGFSSGSYHAVNALNIINGNKSEFQGISHCIESIGKGISKTVRKTFSKDIFKNFLDASNAMWASWGGGLSFIGAAINRATGARKLGSFFRSLGGIMKSLEQVNLGHLRAGKKFFFTSGIAMCAATLCNYLSEFIPKTHGVLYPISIGLDDLAKCLLTISQKTEIVSHGKSNDK